MNNEHHRPIQLPLKLVIKTGRIFNYCFQRAKNLNDELRVATKHLIHCLQVPGMTCAMPWNVSKPKPYIWPAEVRLCARKTFPTWREVQCVPGDGEERERIQGHKENHILMRSRNCLICCPKDQSAAITLSHDRKFAEVWPRPASWWLDKRGTASRWTGGESLLAVGCNPVHKIILFWRILDFFQQWHSNETLFAVSYHDLNMTCIGITSTKLLLNE